MSERLEHHGIRFRLNGIPLYSEPDDEGDVYMTGRIEEPRWTWKDLTPEEQAFILNKIETYYYPEGQKHDPAWFNRPRCLQIAYEEYGIACPHPEEFRQPAPGYGPESYVCAVCTGAVIKKPAPKPAYPPAEAHIRSLLERIRTHGEGGFATFQWQGFAKARLEVRWCLLPILPDWREMYDVTKPPTEIFHTGHECKLEGWTLDMEPLGLPKKTLEFYGDDTLVKWWLENMPL